MEGLQNGLEQRLKPPLMPKPSRYRQDNSRPSTPTSATQLHPSRPVERSVSKTSGNTVTRSPSTVSGPHYSSPNPIHSSGHSTIFSSVGFPLNLPSGYSAITILPSSGEMPGFAAEMSTGSSSVRISSSTTSSSDTPLSPSSGFTRQDSKCSSGHYKPAPIPSSPSCSLNNEEGDPKQQLTTSPTHIYPSPPYTMDSKTVRLSSPHTSPVRDPMETLSLQELVEKHSESFPLQIQVVQGYVGQTSQLTIASGDYYNIHFVKHQEVVSMTDKLSFHYTIPLNSSFQFGLVYSDDTSTRDSQVFEKVSHLISLSPLPRVACAMRDVRANDERNTITAGEILVLKRVIRPKLRRKSLEVLSLKTQTIKILHLDCDGHFSLSPQRNKIYLLELVRCIPDIFPCKAKMFLSSDTASNTQKTSHSLLHAVITLTGQKNETSLIASSVTYTSYEDQSGEMGAQVNEHLVDIPVDDRLSGVAVSVVDMSECGLQEILNHRTRTLFETFDVTRVQSWYDPASDDVATQSLLYGTIGRGSERVGVQVEKPMAAFSRDTSVSGGDQGEKSEALYETVFSPSLHRRALSYRLPQQPSNECAMQYEEPSIHHTLPTITTPSGETFPDLNLSLPANITDSRPHPSHDRLPPLPKTGHTTAQKSLRRSKSHYILPPSDLDGYEDMHAASSPSPRSVLHTSGQQSSDSRLEQLVTATDSLQTQLNQLTITVSAIEQQLRDVAQMSAVTKRLLEGVSALTLQANQLHGSQSVSRSRGSVVVAKSSRTEAQTQQNRLFLETLDLPQVEGLLRAMGLPQYITRFCQERVTGSVLLHCNEAILERELGVESQLHRKRLLALIAGDHSAKDILSRHSTHTL